MSRWHNFSRFDILHNRRVGNHPRCPMLSQAAKRRSLRVSANVASRRKARRLCLRRASPLIRNDNAPPRAYHLHVVTFTTCTAMWITYSDLRADTSQPRLISLSWHSRVRRDGFTVRLLLHRDCAIARETARAPN